MTWAWRLLTWAFAPKWVQLICWFAIGLPIWLSLLFFYANAIYLGLQWLGAHESVAAFIAMVCWAISLAGSIIGFFAAGMPDRIEKWLKS